MQETFSGGDACRQMTTGAHRHGPRGGIFLRTFLGFLALTLATVLVTAAYGVLAALGVAPSVTQEQAMNLVVSLVSVLAALGIVVDPTTAGMADSTRAMGYDEPRGGDGR